MNAWLPLTFLTLLAAGTAMAGRAGAQGGPQLAHMVFFELNDASEEAAAELVAACEKYLSGHDGTVYFSAGARAKELDREVNDVAFDVALHVVFESKAAHDAYQSAPRHLTFIEENRAGWKSVRVFDSYLAAATE
jgi:hypothetical protein